MAIAHYFLAASLQLSAIQPSASNASPLGPRLKVLSSMDDFETVTPKQDPYRSWTEQRTDRFIVEYLCRTGSLTAAEAYARERQLEDLVDIGLFAECHRIEEALTDRQSCSEALAWCGENRGTLKKTQVGKEARKEDFLCGDNLDVLIPALPVAERPGILAATSRIH